MVRAVVFELADAGRCLEIRYEGKDLGDIRALEDALAVTDREAGSIVVPCREGLLIPTDSGVAFKQTFGTSEYEGCHMNMLGLWKKGAALAVTWDDAYVWADVQSTLPEGQPHRQKITAAITLRQSGPLLSRMAAGQGRLEHAGGRLPADRGGQGSGGHPSRPHSAQSAHPSCSWVRRTSSSGPASIGG